MSYVYLTIGNKFYYQLLRPDDKNHIHKKRSMIVFSVSSKSLNNEMGL